MDKKIANHFIVGIFVTAGFAGFLFIIFSMGGGKGFFSSEFKLYGKFSHVKGLNYGSEVSLAGLRIGVVKGISVAPGDKKELVVELSIENDEEKIREDSIATIRTSGMLGDKYIEISIGSPDKPALKANSFLLAEEPEDLFAKSGTLVEEISGKFKKGSDFDTLLKNLNRVALNVAVLTSQLQKDKGLWGEVVAGTSGTKVSKATGHLEQILRKIDAGEGSLGALINDPTVYEDLKSLMGGAKRSAVLKYFMRSFIDSGSQPGPNAPPPPGPPTPSKK